MQSVLSHVIISEVKHAMRHCFVERGFVVRWCFKPIIVEDSLFVRWCFEPIIVEKGLGKEVE